MHLIEDQEKVDSISQQGFWYALSTRHQHEKTVADLLTRKGFETFLPLYSVTHRWKDRSKVLNLPLYPSYVFLKGGFERRLQVLMTPGVLGVVSFAGQPGVIPDCEIEAIRRVVTNRLRVEPWPFLKCGDRVRVKDGPLEGVEGLLVRKKNDVRLVLSVELLSQSVAVELDSCLVELVGKGVAMPIPCDFESPVYASV